MRATLTSRPASSVVTGEPLTVSLRIPLLLRWKTGIKGERHQDPKNASNRKRSLVSSDDPTVATDISNVISSCGVYLSKRSQRKLYPCHIRKSSRRVWETPLESLRKHESPANISTISRGDRSSDCCMFCTHVDKHSFSVKIKKIKYELSISIA